MTSANAIKQVKRDDIYVKSVLSSLSQMVTSDDVDENTKAKITDLLDTLDPQILDNYFDGSDTEVDILELELSPGIDYQESDIVESFGFMLPEGFDVSGITKELVMLWRNLDSEDGTDESSDAETVESSDAASPHFESVDTIYPQMPTPEKVMNDTYQNIDYNEPPKYDGNGSNFSIDREPVAPPAILFDTSGFINEVGDGETAENDVSSDDAS